MIREMFERAERVKRIWRRSNITWDDMRANYDRLEEAGEELRARLPFQTSIAYAYNPHQHATSNGGYHLIVEEAVVAGRLKREKGDALCRPAKKFWGLETEAKSKASCVKCLEIAERLAK